MRVIGAKPILFFRTLFLIEKQEKSLSDMVIPVDKKRLFVENGTA
jgi:hypothetical protein